MDAWHQFLCEQEKELGKETVERWLKPFKVVDFDAGNLYLEAQDSFQLAWFNEHIQHKLKTKLFTPTGRRIKVHVKMREDLGKKQAYKKEKEGAKKKIFLPTLNLVEDTLDPEATLEKFFVSSPNELLIKFIHEAISGEMNKMGSNPIYIYGPSGSGKSHLLMGIAEHFRKKGLSVFFIRAETFTEHVVAAIRNGAMIEFRKAYRHVDVLIIDDVHFFSRKGATQEELFHTFNALHSSGKQIILSAGCPPQFLEAIEPRLISRFEWGVVLRLEKMQEDETRNWLKKRADLLSLPLDEDAFDFLIKTLHAQPKSLQNALHALSIRLHLKSHKDPKIDAKKVEVILADLLESEKQKELNPQKILRAVADYYGIRFDDLVGKSQAKDSAVPRQMAMHLMRLFLHLSYLQIGRVFSRDHSTVMSSIKQVEKKLKAEEKETCSAKIEISRQLQL